MSTTFAIKNGVGSLTVKGKTYAKDTYVHIQYIQNDYNVSREKLWGSDSGRSLAGTYQGSLVGIFPKLTINVTGARLDYTDVKSIVRLVDQQTAMCRYWDDRTAAMVEKKFYFDSISITHKHIDPSAPKNNRYDAISIVAVPISKE